MLTLKYSILDFALIKLIGTRHLLMELAGGTDSLLSQKLPEEFKTAAVVILMVLMEGHPLLQPQ